MRRGAQGARFVVRRSVLPGPGFIMYTALVPSHTRSQPQGAGYAHPRALCRRLVCMTCSAVGLLLGALEPPTLGLLRRLAVAHPALVVFIMLAAVARRRAPAPTPTRH